MRTLLKIYDDSKPMMIKLASVETDEGYTDYMPKVIRFADNAGITDEGRVVEVIGCCEFQDDKVVSL